MKVCLGWDFFYTIFTFRKNWSIFLWSTRLKNFFFLNFTLNQNSFKKQKQYLNFFWSADGFKSTKKTYFFSILTLFSFLISNLKTYFFVLLIEKKNYYMRSCICSLIKTKQTKKLNVCSWEGENHVREWIHICVCKHLYRLHLKKKLLKNTFECI